MPCSKFLFTHRLGRLELLQVLISLLLDSGSFEDLMLCLFPAAVTEFELFFFTTNNQQTPFSSYRVNNFLYDLCVIFSLVSQCHAQLLVKWREKKVLKVLCLPKTNAESSLKCLINEETFNVSKQSSHYL